MQRGPAGALGLAIAMGTGLFLADRMAHPLQAAPVWVDAVVLREGRVRFSLSATPDLTYRIEASTNLGDWMALTNLASPSGTIQFIDLNATNFSQRVYRAVLTPASVWETADIGAVWSDNFDRPALGTNWIILGGANATIMTNQLQFVHASTDTSRQVYYQPWLTSSDQWTLRWSQRFGTNAGTVGVGFVI